MSKYLSKKEMASDEQKGTLCDNATDGIWNGIKYFKTVKGRGVFIELNEIVNVIKDIQKSLQMQENILYKACLNENINIINATVNGNENVCKLMVLSYFGYYNIIKKLIEKSQSVVNEQNYNGYTPLHMAVEGGYNNIIELLIKYGSDVNVTTNDGVSPLFLAVKKGYIEVVKVLLHNMADANLCLVFCIYFIYFHTHLYMYNNI